MSVACYTSSELWKTLIEKCQAQLTGTIFLVTEENRSGKIIIQQGKLTGISYGGKHNMDAFTMISGFSNIRHSFTHDHVFPLREKLSVEEAKTVMKELGLKEYQQQMEQEKLTAKEPKKHSLATGEEINRGSSRLYRGQEVHTKPIFAEKREKKNIGSPRVYRGRTIE